MGFSVSWLAIRGKTPQLLLDELALQPTGDFEDVPESDVLGKKLDDDWYLVFANRCDFVEPLPLAQLSTGCEIVTCSLEEHVMCSHASMWKEGIQQWAVDHDASVGVEHLVPVGELPERYEELRAEAEKGQADEDPADEMGVDHFFSVPIELAGAIIGFSHDEYSEDDEYAVLQRTERKADAGTGTGCLGLFALPLIGLLQI